MKLKNRLILTFLALTLIPTVIISVLLYKSGYSLSKESYTRNLIESIHVQADYISQTLENDMVSDERFVKKNFLQNSGSVFSDARRNDLLAAFQSYLEEAEDKISVCILLDKDDKPIYTIGENEVLAKLRSQLPVLSELSKQTMMEFDLGENTYSLGCITPIRDAQNTYLGSMVTMYNQSYIFKIISSYYKIADTSTYICRSDGGVINSRRLSDDKQNTAITQALVELTLTTEGVIDMRIDRVPVSGYYKNIPNSPWYLVGFIDHALIYQFTNQYILVYILIILGILIADILLSVYFSEQVVKPIKGLIKVMEIYQNSLSSETKTELQSPEKSGYYETRYLWSKFLGLMKTIELVRHNFEGIYQLYQSSVMADTNIDIDVKAQTVSSNKEDFQELMNQLHVAEGSCIVDRFVLCFCEKDQTLLTKILEGMRDEHLSVAQEAEVYSPFFNEKWFHILVVPMYEDDRLSRLYIQLRDISGFKKQQLASIEQARRDALTGLYNRSGFAECAGKFLQLEGASDLHGLLFIDMDYFKLVNDNLGHHAGDDLLRDVGQALTDTVGALGIVSRFGGDEFAVFLPHTTMEVIASVKETLGKRLVYPFETTTASFVVSASIGTACWSPSSTESFERLLQKADESMYQAKRTFKEHAPH